MSYSTLSRSLQKTFTHRYSSCWLLLLHPHLFSCPHEHVFPLCKRYIYPGRFLHTLVKVTWIHHGSLLPLADRLPPAINYNFFCRLKGLPNSSLSFLTSVTDRMTNWLVGKWTAWPTEWLTERLDRLLHWFNGSDIRTDRLTDLRSRQFCLAQFQWTLIFSTFYPSWSTWPQIQSFPSLCL